jgi:CHASE1-domain containing sensor protein
MERIKLQWKIKRHKKWRIFAFLILVSFIAARLIVWTAIDNANSQTETASFNAIIQDDMQELQHQLEVYSDSLYSGRALFYVDKTVSRQDWTNFVDAQNVTQRYPGFYAISYVSVISRSQSSDLINQLNANRLPSEQNPITIYPTSTNENLAVVTYIAPENANQQGIGYDFFTDQTRTQDLNTARDTGVPRASIPLSQLSDKKGTPPSILLAIPVYNTSEVVTNISERQSALNGYIVLALHSHQLLDSIFKAPIPYGNLALAVSSNGRVIYQTSIKPTNQHLQKTVVLDFAGQPWHITFGAAEGFGLSQTARITPIIVLVSTIPFVLVLYIAFYYFVSFKILRQFSPKDSGS